MARCLLWALLFLSPDFSLSPYPQLDFWILAGFCDRVFSPSASPRSLCSLHTQAAPWLELLLPSLEQTCPVLHHSQPVARQPSITWISLPSSQTNCSTGDFSPARPERDFSSLPGSSEGSPVVTAGCWLCFFLTLPPHLPPWHLGGHTLSSVGRFVGLWGSLQAQPHLEWWQTLL